MAQFYLKLGQFEKARAFAKRLVATHPTHLRGQELLDFIHRQLGIKEP